MACTQNCAHPKLPASFPSQLCRKKSRIPSSEVASVGWCWYWWYSVVRVTAEPAGLQSQSHRLCPSKNFFLTTLCDGCTVAVSGQCLSGNWQSCKDDWRDSSTPVCPSGTSMYCYCGIFVQEMCRLMSEQQPACVQSQKLLPCTQIWLKICSHFVFLARFTVKQGNVTRKVLPCTPVCSPPTQNLQPLCIFGTFHCANRGMWLFLHPRGVPKLQIGEPKTKMDEKGA